MVKIKTKMDQKACQFQSSKTIENTPLNITNQFGFNLKQTRIGANKLIYIKQLVGDCLP